MIKTILFIFFSFTSASEISTINKEYQLPHYAINHPPVVTQNITNKQVQVNTFFSYKLPLREVFNDPDGDDLIYEIREKGKEDIPFWIDFDQDQFGFIGNPVEEDQGVHQFTVTAFDQEGKNSSTSFALEVIPSNVPQKKEFLVSDTAFSEKYFWRYVDNHPISSLYTFPEKEVILFLGNTGSGKSTTINYLLEHPMVLTQKKYKKVIDVKKSTKGLPIAPLGHKKTTKTYFPQSYTHNMSNYLYVDTLGFGHDKGTLSGLYNALSINQLIKRANTLKAIFCVVSIPEIEAQRGTLLVNLLQKLSSSIHNTVQHGPNIFWLFTKVNPEMTEHGLISEIKDIKDASFFKVNKNTFDILDSILTNKNIFIINPLDNGKSRDVIFRALGKIKNNILQRDFHVPIAYDEQNRVPLLKHLFINEKIVKNDLLGRLEKITERVEKQEKQLKEIQSTLQQEQPFQTYTKIKEEEKKSWQAVQNKIEKEIEKIKERRKEIVRYKRIRTDLSVYFFTDSVNISYQDIPFEKGGPKIFHVGGDLNITDNRPSEGIYIATYTLSPSYKNALIVTTSFVTISSFVFTTIARSKPFIPMIFCMGLLFFLSSKKAHIDIEFYSKKTFIDQSYMNTLSQKLGSCQGNISQIESYIHDLEQEIKKSMETKASNLEKHDIMENKKRLTSYQQILENGEERMRLIQDIYDLIGPQMNTSSLDRFITRYRQCGEGFGQFCPLGG